VGGHASILSVNQGWKLIVLIDAWTKIPLAATVVPIQEHETLSLRALITQARTNLAGHAHLPKVVFDKGFLDGVELWWLDHHGITFVVPAKETKAKRPGVSAWRPRWWGSPA
jgi:hypothetical protein